MAAEEPRSDEPATKRPVAPEPSVAGGLSAQQSFGTIVPAAGDTQNGPIGSAGKPWGSQEAPTEFGRYRIIRPLGKGAMGSVYLAEDSQLRRQVALKVPQLSEIGDDSRLERFYREARLAATLHHPNICPIHDVGEHQGTHFISMAYVEGRPLSTYVRPHKPMSERAAASVIRKVALALDFAHAEGVIHRDLKPANIIINQRGEPMVMDFGLASRINSANQTQLTQSGAILGTPAYMSPEQVQGATTKIGAASDIYALGAILYELLTGKVPFEGSLMMVLAQIATRAPKPPSAVRPGVHPDIEAICLKAMARRIGDRYSSMAELAEELTRFLRRTARSGATSREPDELPTGSHSDVRGESLPVVAGADESRRPAGGLFASAWARWCGLTQVAQIAIVAGGTSIVCLTIVAVAGLILFRLAPGMAPGPNPVIANLSPAPPPREVRESDNVAPGDAPDKASAPSERVDEPPAASPPAKIDLPSQNEQPSKNEPSPRTDPSPAPKVERPPETTPPPPHAPTIPPNAGVARRDRPQRVLELMNYIPRDANVAIGFDVRRVTQQAVVNEVAQSLLQRYPAFAAGWQELKVQAGSKFGVADPLDEIDYVLTAWQIDAERFNAAGYVPSGCFIVSFRSNFELGKITGLAREAKMRSIEVRGRTYYADADVALFLPADNTLILAPAAHVSEADAMRFAGVERDPAATLPVPADADLWAVVTSDLLRPASSKVTDSIDGSLRTYWHALATDVELLSLGVGFDPRGIRSSIVYYCAGEAQARRSLMIFQEAQIQFRSGNMELVEQVPAVIRPHIRSILEATAATHRMVRDGNVIRESTQISFEPIVALIYEGLPLQPGDIVEITADGAEVKSDKDEVLGTAPKSQKFKVEQAEGERLMIEVFINGQRRVVRIDREKVKRVPK